MTVVAGLAGGLAVAGLLLFCRELAGNVPTRAALLRRARFSPAASRWLAFAMATAIATFAVTGWPVAAIAAAAAVLFLPRVTSNRAALRQVAVLEGLEHWTRGLSDLLSASRGLEDALEASAERAPEAIAPAVAALARRIASGAGIEQALRAFADDIADPAGDRIAAALIIATGRRGGAAREVLRSLAGMLSREVASRREIEAERAQHRTTVKWLACFVVGFTVFAVLDRTYSTPYGTLTGQAVLACVVALYAGGLGWLNHLGRVPQPDRFLNDASTSRAVLLPTRASTRLPSWRQP
jgi:Flp pilus assembly protein TadB